LEALNKRINFAPIYDSHLTKRTAARQKNRKNWDTSSKRAAIRALRAYCKSQNFCGEVAGHVNKLLIYLDDVALLRSFRVFERIVVAIKVRDIMAIWLPTAQRL